MIRTSYAIALGLLSVSLPAHAESVPASRLVSIADLNLGSVVDRNLLDYRLQRAAVAVCGAKSVGDGIGNEAIDNCRHATLAKARRDAQVRIAAGATTVRLAALKK